MFSIDGFDISILYDVGLFDFVRPAGYYVIEVNGTKLDMSIVGFFKAKKLYKKVKEIYNGDKNDIDAFNKKDAYLRFARKESHTVI